MKILNLFAGIGGNRTLWGNKHNITAIENDSRIAYIYHKRFPNDNVIVTDAYNYLIKYFHKFDIIWASPPCTTHTVLSKLRAGYLKRGLHEKPSSPLPDMRLYSLIIFLKHIFKRKWAVENVKPYYEPLIKPTSVIGRHYIWASTVIPTLKKNGRSVQYKKEHLNRGDSTSPAYKIKGVDVNLSKYFDYYTERGILNNCVRPEEGKWILDHLIGKKKQTRLF